ncbi:MAG: hypothetical protein EOO14_06985 [Chitinophagaceae bacterium]|nr:MAG: hypothetical protein EOO14_06985 [Chitinophagaceae bacterium]
MKPLLLVCFVLVMQMAFGQSLDYISVRKANGRVLKNVYAGSNVLLQLTDGSYLQGPVKAVRNDSLFVILYDIRYYPTNFGTYVRDTITTSVIGARFQDIKRIHLQQRKGFLKRVSGPLLMIGGGGYIALNVLNGGFYNDSVTSPGNLRKIGTAAGVFGLGFLLHKLFASDGFSKPKHNIVYVDL